MTVSWRCFVPLYRDGKYTETANGPMHGVGITVLDGRWCVKMPRISSPMREGRRSGAAGTIPVGRPPCAGRRIPGETLAPTSGLEARGSSCLGVQSLLPP